MLMDQLTLRSENTEGLERESGVAKSDASDTGYAADEGSSGEASSPPDEFTSPLAESSNSPDPSSQTSPNQSPNQSPEQSPQTQEESPKPPPNQPPEEPSDSAADRSPSPDGYVSFVPPQTFHPNAFRIRLRRCGNRCTLCNGFVTRWKAFWNRGNHGNNTDNGDGNDDNNRPV